MLDDIKDVERNQAVRSALKAWLDAGKPKDALPCFPIMSVEAPPERKASSMCSASVFAFDGARGLPDIATARMPI